MVWIILGIGIVLSVTGAIIGARIGRDRIVLGVIQQQKKTKDEAPLVTLIRLPSVI